MSLVNVCPVKMCPFPLGAHDHQSELEKESELEKRLRLEARCARLEQTIKEVQDCGQSHFRYFGCMCGAHMKRTLAEGQKCYTDTILDTLSDPPTEGQPTCAACDSGPLDRNTAHTHEGQP